MKIKKSMLTVLVMVFGLALLLVSNACKSNDDVEELKDIVDTAIEAGNFSTLVTAVQAAGLVDALKQPGPFTVFAPTDDAFAQLPAGTLDALLQDIPTLQSILLYHVAAGNFPAQTVLGLSTLEMLSGQFATISVQDGNAMIDNAMIVQTDILCTNGVIHVIDAVIIPQN
jgi:uncharacterized surface protein with fasciclin (FAS1) repeats